jgi:hypothetical protein
VEGRAPRAVAAFDRCAAVEQSSEEADQPLPCSPVNGAAAELGVPSGTGVGASIQKDRSDPRKAPARRKAERGRAGSIHGIDRRRAREQRNHDGHMAPSSSMVDREGLVCVGDVNSGAPGE